MSDSTPLPSETRVHRHRWAVAWSYKAGPGRVKEHLRCKDCEAFKGRYVKAPKK